MTVTEDEENSPSEAKVLQLLEGGGGGSGGCMEGTRCGELTGDHDTACRALDHRPSSLV